MQVTRINMLLLVLGLLSLVAGCNGTPLAEYQSRNRSEEEIKAVLLEYLDAKRQFDIDRYLAGLHAEGRYHFECGRMLSKAELGQLLPKFWTDLRSGNSAFYPINRECITGDYFDTGRYVDPRMDIARENARVALKFTVGWWRLEHLVSLVKENEHWFINRLDWAMN
ncbi:MAG: hypothetical protein GY697_21860 [Desulfobacterales bacterium]|nr:hypothetical protein [Desulfobacterales bacterium]